MLSLSIDGKGGQTRRTVTELVAGGLNVAEPVSPTTGMAAVQEQLLRWYESHSRKLPWRHSQDPYRILVSEVLLQQTQVDRVIPKYHEFLNQFPTLAALAAASVGDVIRVWSPLGYNRRAVNLHRLANEVQRRHAGVLPQDVEGLRSLPGIGPYTAAAVACFAFGREEAVVDTNIRRVLGRLHRRDLKKAAEAQSLAARSLPAGRASDWNQALMDLGATICKAAAPACLLCPIGNLCPSRGVVVREKRSTYAAAAKPFRSSDRYLRGRIVELLRSQGRIRFEALPVQLQLAGEESQARLKTLVAALKRDGLLAEDGDPDCLRLPP
jgi:A/G-specific adenine glycosylase